MDVMLSGCRDSCALFNFALELEDNLQGLLQWHQSVIYVVILICVDPFIQCLDCGA
jgi:hypothetical protein